MLNVSHRVRVFVMSLMLGAALLSVPSEAFAQRVHVGGALGGAIGVTDNTGAQFRLSSDVGLFLEGELRGLLLDFSMAFSFGDGRYAISLAPRASYFFDVASFGEGFTVQLAPTASIPGFALTGPGVGGGADLFFYMNAGGAFRLLLPGEEVALLFRPFEFEFFIGDGVFVRYLVTFGVDVHF